ncbi:hypothetical protein AGMMS50268_15020 [Spirochaetia bacterium]|nr:hypothetical protein AGMMS50268_15020 [Spirochaetia bacterium]
MMRYSTLAPHGTPCEVLINYGRIILAALVASGQFGLLILRLLGGAEPLPLRAFAPSVLFLLYGIILFFCLRRNAVKNSAPPLFKYCAIILDTAFITFCILMTGSYADLVFPPVFVGVYSLVFFVFILLGALRRDIPSVVFSAVASALAYLVVILSLKEYLGASFTVLAAGKTMEGSFPLFGEYIRAAALLVTGLIIALVMKGYEGLLKKFESSEAQSAEEAAAVFAQARELVKTMGESAGAISVSYRDNLSTANHQAAGVEEIEATINENVRIAGEIADKTGSVATIASKMENDVLTGFGVLEKNVKKMGDIKEKNSGVINGILSLGNKITKIRDIIRVINTITDQTKVIAFNAALEAASAGETGKRFAVVAGEVNRLADDIAGLTRQIREQVEEIQNSSSSLIISSEEGSDRIAEGYRLIKDLEDIFKEIRSGAEITSNQAQAITGSTQKQRKSSEQINLAIADISQGLKSFIRATEAATSSAEELTGLAEELRNTLLTENKATNGN